jgi:hypothetical protein
VAAAGTEDQLAWEASQRKRAAVAAILAGVLLLVSDIWFNVAVRGGPTPQLLDSLLRLPEPGSIADQTSLRVPAFEFLQHEQAARLGSSALRAVGFLALAWALTFLAVATRARRPEMARPFVYMPVVGAVLLAVQEAVRAIAFDRIVDDFLSGSRTVGALEDLGGSLLLAADLIQFVGTFALAIGYVVVSLNAMRAGLLTRFMGYLGIIVGFLLILPLAVVPVQPLWLIALGVLFWGSWPGGVPPAWRTGRAEPWPGRERLAQPATANGPAPAPAPDPTRPAAQKRKRKRRS